REARHPAEGMTSRPGECAFEPTPDDTKVVSSGVVVFSKNRRRAGPCAGNSQVRHMKLKHPFPHPGERLPHQYSDSLPMPTRHCKNGKFEQLTKISSS